MSCFPAHSTSLLPGPPPAWHKMTRDKNREWDFTCDLINCVLPWYELNGWPGVTLQESINYNMWHLVWFLVHVYNSKLWECCSKIKWLQHAAIHLIVKVMVLVQILQLVMCVNCCGFRSHEKALSCCTYIDLLEARVNPIPWGRDRNLFFDKDAYKVHANVSGSLSDVACISCNTVPHPSTTHTHTCPHTESLSPSLSPSCHSHILGIFQIQSTYI